MRIKTKDNPDLERLKNTYENGKNEIVLSAILNCVYLNKMSHEIINTKISHQANAIEASIYRINPKFAEKKSKNQDKIKEEILKILADYEQALKEFCKIHDKKIQSILLKKVELETKLLMASIIKQDLYQKELQKNTKRN